mmetsp:Transcript_41622/g.109773  ORF Transcript_41622/g.109773 Transcript_41622/m.109773 type:complete len:218 (-) Transcript_41622:174-827(-)
MGEVQEAAPILNLGAPRPALGAPPSRPPSLPMRFPRLRDCHPRSAGVVGALQRHLPIPPGCLPKPPGALLGLAFGVSPESTLCDVRTVLGALRAEPSLVHRTPEGRPPLSPTQLPRSACNYDTVNGHLQSPLCCPQGPPGVPPGLAPGAFDPAPEAVHPAFGTPLLLAQAQKIAPGQALEFPGLVAPTPAPSLACLEHCATPRFSWHPWVPDPQVAG